MSERSGVPVGPVTMRKIYTGVTLVGAIVGVVVWALTNFVSAGALTSTIEAIEKNYDLKYFPNDRGVKLEIKVESLEETLAKISPQLAAQSEMLIKVLVQQEITIQRLQAIEKLQSKLAHP